ncbi:YjgN family protein [Rhabdaerophilum calidifontis]|uniref:YjgN family protein n=1 Tax=Rhabdaerophilum calidifontis TaxID=2604328 RepID=UPI00140BA2FC|nr:DUF898 family protein [Rhabdaerophilum calidifontis]
MVHVPTITRAWAVAPVPSAPASSGEPAGRRLEPVDAPLAGLVLRGLVLTFATLGLYRFWYRTALRRYYWGQTRLLGDAFEYTGTGRELFIGFLIALAIIVPINLAVTLLGLFGGALFGPFLSSFVALVLVPALVQIALYRARRYRLSRTRFRGIRFRQGGTGTAYLARTVKWLLIAGATFGILLPYLRAAQERYKIDNTWFGSAQGAFEARIRPLMGPWIACWLTALCTLAGFAAAILMLLGGNVALAAGAALFGGLALITLPFLWMNYRVREFRAFTGGTRLGPLAFRADLALWPVIGIFLRYALALGLVVLAAAAALLAGGGADAGVEGAAEALARSGPGGWIVLAGGALAALLAAAFLGEFLLRRPLWRRMAASVTVLNAAALDAIVQTAQQDSRGIGEAFDTGFDLPV